MFIVLIPVLLVVGCHQGERGSFEQDWSDFKARFISSDGRVIDDGNGGISHSEGQGVALLLAVAGGDQECFERTWHWTQSHLQIRSDHLLAWKWSPEDNPPVLDKNNATDGDLLVAWALYRASVRWNQPNYAKASLEILTDLRAHVGRTWNNLQILLPGADGFVVKDGIIVNLSYWLFPAFADFERIDPKDGFWKNVTASGLALLNSSRFGHWGLPTDWLALTDAQPRPAPQHAPRFGYDAIRIPLYLAWSGRSEPGLNPYDAYWQAHSSFVPAWYDVIGNMEDGIGAPPGIVAVKTLVTAIASNSTPAWEYGVRTDDYYSSILRLLSQLAFMEVARR